MGVLNSLGHVVWFPVDNQILMNNKQKKKIFNFMKLAASDKIQPFALKILPYKNTYM